MQRDITWGWSHRVLLLVPEERFTHLPVAVNRVRPQEKLEAESQPVTFQKPEWRQCRWKEGKEGRKRTLKEKNVPANRERQGGEPSA